MSDADRALSGQKRRIAARAEQSPEFVADEDSLPVIVDSHDDETPVEMRRPGKRRKRQTIQEFAEDIKGEVRELRAAVDESIRAELNNRVELAQRLTEVETRLDFMTEIGGASPAAELLKLRGDLSSLRTLLIGEDGKNGMMSQVRDEATKGPRFVKRAIGIALGSIIGSLIPAALWVNHVTSEAAAERASVAVQIEAARAERVVLQSQVLLLFRMAGARDHAAIDSLAPTGVP